jgi:hypothetical protein
MAPGDLKPDGSREDATSTRREAVQLQIEDEIRTAGLRVGKRVAHATAWRLIGELLRSKVRGDARRLNGPGSLRRGRSLAHQPSMAMRVLYR